LRRSIRFRTWRGRRRRARKAPLYEVMAHLEPRLLEDREPKKLVRILLRELIGPAQVKFVRGPRANADVDASTGAQDAWLIRVGANGAGVDDPLHGEGDAVLEGSAPWPRGLCRGPGFVGHPRDVVRTCEGRCGPGACEGKRHRAAVPIPRRLQVRPVRHGRMAIQRRPESTKSKANVAAPRDRRRWSMATQVRRSAAFCDARVRSLSRSPQTCSVAPRGGLTPSILRGGPTPDRRWLQ
jgi:hypothetical protein